MALFVTGMICPLCGKPIERHEARVMFAPFVANRKDRLFLFSDGVFHEECFTKHPLAQQAITRSEELRTRLGPGHRACVVCGESIVDPDDYFTVGFLSDDKSSAAYDFNYVQAHRSHLASWNRYPELRKVVDEYQSSVAWDGPRVRFP